MTSPNSMLRQFTDAAADRVARAIASLQRDAQRERDARETQFAARMAELETRLASVTEIEKRLIERLASLRDGMDGADGVSVTVDEILPALTASLNEVVSEHVDRVLEAWDKPRDGKDFDPEALRNAVAEAVAAIEPPRDGMDGVGIAEASITDDDLLITLTNGEVKNVGRVVGWDGVDIDTEVVNQRISETISQLWEDCPKPKDGERGPMGALPVVRAWEDKVYYQGECASFDGRMYQANRDTGKQPGHEDWTCIVDRGRDARTPRIRSTWTEVEKYEALDIVALGGASFVARKDDPGPCPGEGWQMVASQGKRGNVGERGPKGDKGDRSVTSVSRAIVDDEGVLTIENSDGSVVTCDFYPLLAKVL
jgi:hypothetical protein